MRRDRNYENALAQVAERVGEANGFLARAEGSMGDRRPETALEHLRDAKDAIEGAMTTARWAMTLPEPEDD
jgi:hypothetical protein